jgi:hypothetical protein
VLADADQLVGCLILFYIIMDMYEGVEVRRLPSTRVGVSNLKCLLRWWKICGGMSFVDVGFGAVGETWEELVHARADGMDVHTRVAFTWRLQLGEFLEQWRGYEDPRIYI